MNLLMIFILFPSQADYFFVPPLNLLSDKLKLSPSIAGITLLAIGNGKLIFGWGLYDNCYSPDLE